MTRTAAPPPGFRHLPGLLDPAEQADLAATLRALAAEAPLYRPTMPKSGRPFSVRMTNAGSHGWYSDRAGYRYVARHPETGRPWPAIPAALLDLWHRIADYPADPECCLVNFYAAEARMGLHRDSDEQALHAPVISLSLGDSAIFRIGGTQGNQGRRGATASLRLHSGDVVVLGGAARHAYHGIDRVLGGSSRLLERVGWPALGSRGGGRINVTLRRVTHPPQATL